MALESPPPLAGILVIAIDRLPAWMLPMHGCSWVAMPALTALAGRGVVFDRMIATSDEASRTLDELVGPGDAVADRALLRAARAGGWPAVMVTDDPELAGGEAVCGVPVGRRRTPADDPADTALARLFAAAGQAIAAADRRLVIVHATSLGQIWDAPRSFRDAYVDPDDPPVYPGTTVPDLVVNPETDADELVAIRQAFAGQLTLLDRCIGGLVDRLPPPGVGAAGWAVLVAGLRGLPLGLHGRVGTGPLAAYGEVVHLPAVFVDPAGRMGGQRYGGLVTPGDLGATLLELVGSTAAAGSAADRGGPAGCDTSAEGPAPPASLQTLLGDWRWPDRDRVVVAAAAGSAIATRDWHAVAGAGPLPRLFAKPDDYFELNDVAARCPEEAERLGRVVALVSAGQRAAAWRAPLDGRAAD